MIETQFAVTTSEGLMPVYWARPDCGAHPLVILYMDAYGIRQELRDMALRLATGGYAVALPNLYYRQTHEELGPIPEPDEYERLELLTKCVQSLNIPAVMADTEALLAQADSIPEIDTGRVACIGYCMSGRFAVAAAARYPEKVVAAASFYGTWLVSDDPESPHRSAPKATGRVYFACAEDDHWSPLEVVGQLKQALSDAGSLAEVELYLGASHAFAFPERRQYDRLAAARHWERITSLLRDTCF